MCAFHRVSRINSRWRISRFSIGFRLIFSSHTKHIFLFLLQLHTASTINSHSILPKFPHAFPGHVCVCVLVYMCCIHEGVFKKIFSQYRMSLTQRQKNRKQRADREEVDISFFRKQEDFQDSFPLFYEPSKTSYSSELPLGELMNVSSEEGMNVFCSYRWNVNT